MTYKIVVINLKHREDRKNNMIKLFNENNITDDKYNIYFYEAVYGTKIDLSLEIKYLFNDNDFGSRKSFIGCALSHYNIWLDLISDTENDFYIIFEDDIVFCNNFENYLDKCINRVLNKNNIDIQFIGFTKYKYQKDYDNWNNNDIEFIDFSEHIYIVGGCFGYIITKSGAKKLINLIKHSGIKHGIDYYIRINKINLNMELVKPSIVYTQWCNLESYNIVDSDIQKDYNSFHLDSIYDYHNYQFISNMDKINNDVCRENKNINNLINTSNKLNYLSDAFNTIGYIKHSIDKESLQESIWYSNNDGIYIKVNKMYKIKLQNYNDKILNIIKNMTNNNLWKNIALITDNMKIHDIDVDKLNLKYNLYLNCNDESNNNDEIKNNKININNIDYPYWNINSRKHCIKNNNYDSILSVILLPNNNDFINYIIDLNIEDSLKIHYIKEVLTDPITYKYILVDNENIWNGLISECLCFYYGVNNLSNIYTSIIKIDLNNYEESYNNIKNAIQNNEWEKRKDTIKKDKYNLKNYFSIFPTIERRITLDYLKENKINLVNTISTVNTLNTTKVIITTSNFNLVDLSSINYKIISFIVTLNNLNITTNIIYYNNINKYSFYNELINNQNNDIYNNFIILDEKWLLYESYINLINHILYLPKEYDVCYINNNHNFKITQQINSLYYEVKKYDFKFDEPYIISRNGMKKLMIHTMGEFDIYNNIYDLKFYVNKYRLFNEYEYEYEYEYV